ncbi:MAG: aldo/keto reductase [Planctomycetaceae bacterium]|jgi:aryl-alcohol dehydrogenase-like predicted oxidoreductase|nr:aldo/keto reductase [bacterium]MDB4680197.1 aldo/keto reductase [Planctomycetaceae bacterium]MDG2387858.1 aldo/keto reductase [Planctomycetaceae bacterium]
MDYRQLGKTGLRVSPVCLGTMMFGGPTTEADSIHIIHKACDQGVNFIDTADMYSVGGSEEVVGKAIADRRDQVVLATKGTNAMGDGPNDQGASRYHLTAAVDKSLQRLGTDHIDLYYVHVPDETTPQEETLRALDDLVRSGKIRYIACSNFRAWKLCEALWTSDKLNLNAYCCVQPLYNIMNRDIEVELMPLCQEKGIGVVSYSPLARGILTGKYQPGEKPPEGSRASRNDKRMMQAEWRDASLEVAQSIKDYSDQKGVPMTQFALAWCLANPTLTSVIIGPRTESQYDDNIGFLDVEITAEDEAFIDGLVPAGEHSGFGFQDENYPITGRGK